MQKFLEIVEKDFAFVKYKVCDIKQTVTIISGQSTLLFEIKKSNFDLAFYQDFDKYQVQIVPHEIENISIDAPIALMAFDDKRYNFNLQFMDIPKLMEDNWSLLQTAFDKHNIHDTIALCKHIKNQYQKNKWGNYKKP